jgi:hypothetical protein
VTGWIRDALRAARQVAFCRHATAVLEAFRFSLDPLNPASRDEGRRHVRSEMKRLFEG